MGWISVSFNSSVIQVGPITPFEWYIELDQGKFSNGEHTLEVVAFSSNQQSLPVVVQFEGEGEISSSYDFSSLVYVLIAIIGIVPLSIFLLLRFKQLTIFSVSI